MNILWHSVAPWIKTGYGIQTSLFTERIHTRLNHDVSIFAYAGLHAGFLNINETTILPTLRFDQNDQVGTESIKYHAQFTKADLIISLTDIWQIKSSLVKDLPWAPWFPVDHDPIPPGVAHVLKESRGIPMVFSRFAEQQALSIGLEPIYIPHGCHPAYLNLVDPKDAREQLGLPQSAFIIGMVGVNNGYPCRKAVPQCLEAIRRIQSKHSNVFLYFHSLESSPTGIDCGPLLSLLEDGSYKLPNPYQYTLGFNENYMTNAYAAMDVLLLPSMGEGFGVPIIEAQAQGTPVIVSDFTAMSELCFFGEMVQGEKFYTNQYSYQLNPYVDDIIEKIEKVIDYSDTERELGKQLAHSTIVNEYHPDTITDKYWAPALEEALERANSR